MRERISITGVHCRGVVTPPGNAHKHRRGVVSDPPGKINSPLIKGARGLSFMPYLGVGAYCIHPFSPSVRMSGFLPEFTPYLIRGRNDRRKVGVN